MADDNYKIIWVDVGTHFGQEYRSIFGGFFWFFLKIFRRFIGSVILRKGENFEFSKFFKTLKLKTDLKKNRKNFFVLFVEANPKIFEKKIYKEANVVNCVALGGEEKFKLGNLFFVDGDETGQGSSIHKNKGNINLNHSILVNIISAEYYAEYIKNHIINRFTKYKIILRINCEGSEDDVIYAFKKIFGKNFSYVFGSLKDVKGVKGEKKFNKLVSFMKVNKIDFTNFSSSVLTWPEATEKISKISKNKVI